MKKTFMLLLFVASFFGCEKDTHLKPIDKDVNTRSGIGIDDVLSENQAFVNPHEVDCNNYGIGFAHCGDLMGYFDNDEHCGYFGLNTNDPQAALHVIGSLKVQSTFCGESINFSTLPVYANEAAASSLTTGDLYRTTTGDVRIKL